MSEKPSPFVDIVSFIGRGGPNSSVKSIIKEHNKPKRAISTIVEKE
jgi:hypothetical protein